MYYIDILHYRLQKFIIAENYEHYYTCIHINRYEYIVYTIEHNLMRLFNEM